MDRGDRLPIQRVPADELVLELQQRPDVEEIHSMVCCFQFGLLRGLLTEENLRVLGQVINQLQQHDDEEDNLQNDEEDADVPAAGIEINPPQEVEGPWVNNRAEIPAGEMEMNAAQQAEDPIAEEMRRFWDDEEAESDSDSNNDSDDDGDMMESGLCYCPPAQYWEVQGGDQGRRRMMKRKMGDPENNPNTEFCSWTLSVAPILQTHCPPS
ncbi:uncharacterized protein LOC120720571 [Simochromis diagramma]|uniref:uncharacterized protein LOC120720571 n=1 Tax=Simochromis diagramma TaxID=43689 RepID=UPI001A7E8D12|nr:uncharacterized protein LOC120720571 [Simochromis diagramma]